MDWKSVRVELFGIAGEQDDGSPLFMRLQDLLSRRPELRKQVFELIDSHELRAVRDSKLMDGAAELLEGLSNRKVALVTLQGRRACEAILRRHGLLGFFSACVTREDSLDRAEQILKAVSSIGGRAEETLFVGDRVNDVVSARRAGVRVALVGRAISGEHRPDHSFSSVRALGSFLLGGSLASVS